MCRGGSPPLHAEGRCGVATIGSARHSSCELANVCKLFGVHCLSGCPPGEGQGQDREKKRTKARCRHSFSLLVLVIFTF